MVDVAHVVTKSIVGIEHLSGLLSDLSAGRKETELRLHEGEPAVDMNRHVARKREAVDLVADLSRQSEERKGSHVEFQVGFVLDRVGMLDVLGDSSRSIVCENGEFPSAHGSGTAAARVLVTI